MKNRLLFFILWILSFFLSIFFYFSNIQFEILNYTIDRTAFFISLYIFFILTTELVSNIFNISTIKKKVTLIVLSFIIIFFSISTNFYNNLISQFDDIEFKYFSIESDSYVIGKIQNYHFEEPQNRSKLLGKYYPIEKININEFTYDCFLNNKKISKQDYINFDIYTAQLGIQGSFFTFLSKILCFLSNKRLLDVFNLFQSLLLGLMITLIILWVYLEFGTLATIFAYFSVIANYWLVIAGKSIFWSWWVFFLPFVLNAFYFRYLGKNRKPKIYHLFIIMLISILIKTSVGFEFISTYLIMSTLPLFYYSIKYEYKWTNFLKSFLTVFITSFFSILLSLGVLFIKLRTIGFTTQEIKKDFDSRILRTHTGFIYSTNRNPEYSLDISRLNTLKIYFIETTRKLMLNHRAIDFVIILIALSIILFTFMRIYKQKNNKTIALISINYLSLLAPISWFILAKAHSLIHPHIDFITFSMPFTILFFAFIGYWLSEIAYYIKAIPILKNTP